MPSLHHCKWTLLVSFLLAINDLNTTTQTNKLLA